MERLVSCPIREWHTLAWQHSGSTMAILLACSEFSQPMFGKSAWVSMKRSAARSAPILYLGASELADHESDVR